MSTLAKTYALQCGVPLSTPTMEESFYPLNHPLDKVILVHAFAGKIANVNGQLQATFAAKCYDYFNEVVAILKPIVTPLGYKIYQIGAPNEPALKDIDNLCGRTTILQCAYLVKRAALLIGNDSQWVHIRGAFGKSLVAVYGSTDVKNHGPEWNDPSQTVLIESHRFGKKPSYSSMENPKTVNLIPIEQVANGALRLLGLPEISRQSLFIGQIFNQPIIELVPNVVIAPQVQLHVAPVIRMDYLHNEENLGKNLHLKKCAIITNREIDVDLLARLRPNILSMRIEIDQVSPDWIKKVKRLGFPTSFTSVTKDDEKIRQMRLDYYDACFFDRFVPPTVEDFRKSVEKYTRKPLYPTIKLDSLTFRTNKFILSEGKVHLSHAHWLAGRDTQSTDDNTGTVIDSPEFWAEQEHLYIFQ